MNLLLLSIDKACWFEAASENEAFDFLERWNAFLVKTLAMQHICCIDCFMRIKDLFALLKGKGWRLDRVRGSHHVFTHPKAKRSVVVPVHDKEIPDFYARSILKQAEASLEK